MTMPLSPPTRIAEEATMDAPRIRMLGIGARSAGSAAGAPGHIRGARRRGGDGPEHLAEHDRIHTVLAKAERLAEAIRDHERLA
jgi:hypothetical protein